MDRKKLGLGVALMVLGGAPPALAIDATAFNQPILTSAGAAIGVNVDTNKPQVGHLANVNVINGGGGPGANVVSVGLTPSQTALQPLAGNLQKGLGSLTSGGTGALSGIGSGNMALVPVSSLNGLTSALAPVTTPLSGALTPLGH